MLWQKTCLKPLPSRDRRRWNKRLATILPETQPLSAKRGARHTVSPRAVLLCLCRCTGKSPVCVLGLHNRLSHRFLRRTDLFVLLLNTRQPWVMITFLELRHRVACSSALACDGRYERTSIALPPPAFVIYSPLPRQGGRWRPCVPSAALMPCALQ